MTAIRTTLALLGTCAFGYAAVALWLLPWLDFGVSVAVCAACVIGLGLVRAIETDRQRARDKARHPSVWGPIQPGDPYKEFSAPDQPLIWPRYTMQPGSWRIEDDGR